MRESDHFSLHLQQHPGDTKSAGSFARAQARQHAATAGGHAQAAQNSRAPDVIAAHRDAEDLHRAAAGHYHNAADAHHRGDSQDAEGHLDRAQHHGRLAHSATRNVGDGRLAL
jgi:hypothetical protein